MNIVSKREIMSNVAQYIFYDSFISYKIMNSSKLFHAKKINSIYIKVLGD